MENERDVALKRLNSLELRLRMSFMNEQRQLSSTLYVKNEKGNEIKLSELIKGKRKLVLRMANTHCSACLYDLCPVVAKFVKSIGIKNIIYLADYENTRVL